MTEQNNETSLERKSTVVVEESEPAPVQLERSIVVSIGINEYVHQQKLKNAVQDAIGFQQTLIDKLGFSAPILPLLNEAATKSAICSLIDDQLYEIVEANDSLVVFFAGHGQTRIRDVHGEEIETGYLVPVDATQSWSDYVEIDVFLKSLSMLPAKHILVILDSCHSGFALGQAMSEFRGSERYEKALNSKISRRVITSARRDELALDGGPIPGHSLFTGTLIDSFNWGRADLDGNGLISSSELGLFIQQQVVQASESKQTPDFGSFHLDDRGEMVISLRNQSFDALKARALSALQTGQFTLFKELTEQAIARKPDSAEALYLEYRLRFAEGKFQRVMEVVDTLVSFDLREVLIPLSNNDLSKIQMRLPCWIPIFSIPEVGFLPEIDVLIGRAKEQLQAIKTRSLGEKQVYLIEPKSFCQLRITNPTSEPLHVYMVGFDETGRFQLETLWSDKEINLNGLMPGETKSSYLFAPQGKQGVREIRLFSSPKQLSFFLFPAPDAYGAQLETIPTEDLENIRMRVIRYSLTNSFLSEEAHHRLQDESK